MKVPFRERDPRALAIFGTITIAVVIAASLLLPQAVFYAKTTTYSAEFDNAAGLQTDDPVYVAGVPSGRVSKIELAGDKALVSFRMDDGREIGSESTVGIKIQTVLGKRYLDLESRGGSELDPDQPIPADQTSVPFSLDDLSRAAATATEEIDMDALRALMSSLEKDSPDPKLAGDALDGIVRATEVFNKHSEKFKKVISGAQQVSKGLLEQKDTLVQLLGNTDKITTMLAKRRDAIGKMITDIATLSKQVAALLDDNRPAIDSLLTRMDTITKTLKDTQKDFNATLKQFAPASRYMANIFGHGRWGDVGSPSAIIPDNILCSTGVVNGCS